MKPRILLSLLTVFFFGVSCRKEPDLGQLSSNFVVVTNTDSAVVFSDYSTFYISDTIAYVASDSKDTIIVGSAAQQIVATVKQNMTARGFTFVPKAADPDLGINLGVVKNTNVGVVYPGWWWGYPGWWDPWYWGWDYPYYYPWSYTYVVTTGSVILDLVDLKDASAEHKETVIWTAFMGGAVGDDVNGNVQRGVNAINQAFIQSPQVKAN